MKKLLKSLITFKLQAHGYSHYYSGLVFEKFFSDLLNNKSTSFRQKIWAQKRGFYSRRIEFYGLTEDNYRNYLSDFDYYRLHPINGRYNRWIDDKLLMKFILHPFNEFLPEYYYHFCNQEILSLMDCPKDFESSIDGVINLLKEKKALAVKPTAGTHGIGFTKLSYINDNFQINHQPSNESGVIDLLDHWRKSDGAGYLITEYLKPHPDLSHIWSETPNALRLMVIRERNQYPKIINAFIRFGNKLTGAIDNSFVGSIICHVDLHTGFFTEGKIIKDEVIYDNPYHPDTEVLVEGNVPYWQMICDEILKISNYLSEIIYFGYDIAVTESGFKIIEINSQQAIGFIQKYSPIFTSELSKDFFKRLVEEKRIQSEQQKNKTFYRRLTRFLKKVVVFLKNSFRKSNTE